MRRLILNSSQGKQPIGNHAWIRATLAAVEEVAQHGHEIVASLGLTSWELALWRAAALGSKVHLVCPVTPIVDRNPFNEQTLASFGLRAEKVVWHWVQSRASGRKSAWTLRDQIAIQLADEVVEVSVKSSGRLAGLLRRYRPKRITTHVVPFERHPGSQWETRAPDSIDSLWPNGALIHLTRSSEGPWPGEPSWRFYEDVAASTDEYARSGFRTLCHILREGCIRGSTFRARGGLPRVCFTACDPMQVVGLIRFRARYARYSFEPYAVVLSPRAAVQLGAKPVSYDDSVLRDPFRQGAGKNGHWQREKEWRVVGDVELSRLDPHEVSIVVATQAEAEALEAWCPYPVRCFGYASSVTT